MMWCKALGKNNQNSKRAVYIIVNDMIGLGLLNYIIFGLRINEINKIIKYY